MNKKTRTSTGFRIACITIALVILFGIVLLLLQFLSPAGKGMKPSEWGRKQEQADDSGSGLIVNEVENPAGAQLVSSAISEEDYADYGISAQAEGAVMLSITNIQPSYATNTKFRWSASFITPSSGWAYGKNVSSYVNVAPATDTLSAVVTCLQPFGARIWVKAYCESNPNVVLTCEFDYTPRYTLSFNLRENWTSANTDTVICKENRTYSPVMKMTSTVGTTASPQLRLDGKCTLEVHTNVFAYSSLTSYYYSGQTQAIELNNEESFNWSDFYKFFTTGASHPDTYLTDLKSGIQTYTSSGRGGSNPTIFVLKQNYSILIGNEVVESGTKSLNLKATFTE